MSEGNSAPGGPAQLPVAEPSHCRSLTLCLMVQMRSLEAQNEAIAGFLVSGDASRLSTPARPQPRRRRRHGHGGAPSEIGCAAAQRSTLIHVQSLCPAADAMLVPGCLLNTQNFMSVLHFSPANFCGSLSRATEATK
jgi:hypothetical protein